MMAKTTKLYFRTISAKSLSRSGARGFTLIELVVVIAIILLLLGLVLAVGLSARAQAETREMQNILLLVDNALKEWELVADRKLSWGENNIPQGITYDIRSDTDPDVQLDQALARIKRVDSVGKILANIDSDFLQQIGNSPPRLHLIDPWGKEVYLVHPGRISNPNQPFNDDPFSANHDGTIRSENEDKYGVAVNRTPLLVSAGPDGKFGNLIDPNSPEFELAADNIYSYRPGSN